MLSYDELSPGERAVWDAVPEGRRVDLRTDESDESGEAPAPAGGRARRGMIRAVVLSELLLGDASEQRGTVPALRLAGARITGRLDLSGGEISQSIWLEDCRLDEEVNLRGATTQSIEILGSQLCGIRAGMARINGRLDLRGSTLRGTLALKNARISGELCLDRAELSVAGGWALDAGGLVMGGGVWCRKGLRVQGGIRMPGASLPGGLFMDGAQLSNPGGAALSLENVTAVAMEFTEGFAADGEIGLQGVKVDGTLTFSGADLGHGRTQLNCARLRAAAFEFTPATPPTGAVDLQGGHVGILRDRADCWPSVVHLQGFVYDSLQSGHETRGEAARRVAWIQRGPGYTPQPYEQLARWYRNIGHDDLARRVLISRQRHRRATLRPAERAWSYVLDATVGFGYQPGRALLWIATLTVFGTALFSTDTPHPTNPGEGAPFNPFVYTLDLLIPIGDLGQRGAWYWTAGLTQVVAYGLVGVGWLLTTALVAGVTRALGKN
jgi:hypothetical protein